MAGAVELRGFMDLIAEFGRRGWQIPYYLELGKEQTTGQELLTLLDIPISQVEVMFVNGKAYLPTDAMVVPGDRVALVPPGTPGPYRVLLGFVNMEKQAETGKTGS